MRAKVARRSGEAAEGGPVSAVAGSYGWQASELIGHKLHPLWLPRCISSVRRNIPMNMNQAATAGIAGAVALTAIHQAAQLFTSNAPRMDVLGRRAIAATLDRGGWKAPAEPALQRWALAGDLVANSLYY